MILTFGSWSFIAIPILIAAGVLTAVTGIKRGSHEKHAAIVPIIGMIIAAFFIFLNIPDIWGGRIISFQMGEWAVPFGITIVVDMLTIVLSAITISVALFATIFSYKFIKKRRPEYYALICLLTAGLIGIFHTGDLFNLFVFFEISNVSSYALVSYYRNKHSAEASIKFLILGSITSSMILLGIAMMYSSFGTLNMADLAVQLTQTTGMIVPIGFTLMLAGFAMKCGLLPFHFWMPDAYQAVPAPIAAILGGLSVNAGVYAILRVGFTVFNAPAMFSLTLISLGIASMLLGAVFAILQTDIKRMLAFSSVSQIGYIMMALGLGTTIGMVGGIFHVINHAIIKALLFFCAGVVIFHAKTSNMHEIGKRARFSPVLTYSFLIGVLALAGIPFLNGFASKWLIYLSTFEITPLLTIFTIVISVLTFAYGIRAFYLIFVSGNGPHTGRTPWSMIIPLIILAAICILIGIMPQLGINVSETIGKGLVTTTYTGAVLG